MNIDKKDLDGNITTSSQKKGVQMYETSLTSKLK
jgi:hypothetical protein